MTHLIMTMIAQLTSPPRLLPQTPLTLMTTALVGQPSEKESQSEEPCVMTVNGDGQTEQNGGPGRERHQKPKPNETWMLLFTVSPSRSRSRSPDSPTSPSQ